MTEKQIADKRVNEDHVCALMIQLYCRGVHKTKNAMKDERFLCPDCAALREYVYQRVMHCPFMETKTFCAMCKVHCYKSDMRQKIKLVMRYAGPRMLRYHPYLAIKHLYLTLKEKHKIRCGK